jgi:hypothetical protein
LFVDQEKQFGEIVIVGWMLAEVAKRVADTSCSSQCHQFKKGFPHSKQPDLPALQSLACPCSALPTL